MVVRSLIPGETGPTGGPAFTDVLGVLEAWSDGVLAIRTEAGDLVTIPAALVVSGKPVPPRPSRFSRMSVTEVEHRCAAFARGPESEATGGRRRERVRVVTGSDVEAELIGRGWQPLESEATESQVHLAGVAALARELHDVAIDDVEYEAQVGSDAVCGSIHRDGHQVATARVTLADSWAFLADLFVQPDHRRQGLAHMIIAGLVEWAAEHGASVVAVQVRADNEAALGLSRSLGFESHHGFRSLIAPS